MSEHKAGRKMMRQLIDACCRIQLRLADCTCQAAAKQQRTVVVHGGVAKIHGERLTAVLIADRDGAFGDFGKRGFP